MPRSSAPPCRLGRPPSSPGASPSRRSCARSGGFSPKPAPMGERLSGGGAIGVGGTTPERSRLTWRRPAKVATWQLVPKFAFVRAVSVADRSKLLGAGRPRLPGGNSVASLAPNGSSRARRPGSSSLARQHDMLRRRHGIKGPAASLLPGSRICNASLRAASRPGRPERRGRLGRHEIAPLASKRSRMQQSGSEGWPAGSRAAQRRNDA